MNHDTSSIPSFSADRLIHIVQATVTLHSDNAGSVKVQVEHVTVTPHRQCLIDMTMMHGRSLNSLKETVVKSKAECIITLSHTLQVQLKLL